MINKNLIIALILLFGILNIKTQCHKDEMAVPEITHQFRQNVSITPYRLDYKVGDTIWLEVNALGKKLYDEKSNTTIVYDSVGFTSIAQVDLLYNNPFVVTGPLVSFIFPSGISANLGSSSSQTFTNISWGCAPSTDYHLRLGLVLLQKGVFGISLFNSAIQKCSNSYYDGARLTYYLDVTDTHLQFYQQLPFASVGKQPDTYIIDRLSKKTMVAVSVN